MLVSIPCSNSEHETCDAANSRSRSGQNLRPEKETKRARKTERGQRRREVGRNETREEEESTGLNTLQQPGADLCPGDCVLSI